MPPEQPNCDCLICKNNIDFYIDQELLNDFFTNKITIFAGAGISTEVRTVLKETFYEGIAADLGITDPTDPFPDIMELYCKQPNGRLKLLREIISRFDSINAFPELNRSATRFHDTLSTMYFISNIITTNWDMYFETNTHATPFVVDQDLAFWEVAKRKVLKIHGSVSNIGTIIATRTDYNQRVADLQTGLIGGLLKHALSTQTIIFIGYSCTDDDFKYIYSFVKSQMKGLHKQAYIVTPFSSESEKLRDLGLIPIITDGTYFLETIKEHAINSGIMLPDKTYKLAQIYLDYIESEHGELNETISPVKYPQVIYSLTYQDGLIHALERCINRRGTGEYSHPCHIIRLIEAYQTIYAEKLRQRRYSDVAYVAGYIDALCLLLEPPVKGKKIFIPLYFAFGHNEPLYSFSAYKKILSKLPDLHKASYKEAVRVLKPLSDPTRVVIHHPPWL